MRGERTVATLANPLQPTATHTAIRCSNHCNTHCNTLQSAATRCNTNQKGRVGRFEAHILSLLSQTRCNPLQHTLQHTTTCCNMLQHAATRTKKVELADARHKHCRYCRTPAATHTATHCNMLHHAAPRCYTYQKGRVGR